MSPCLDECCVRDEKLLAFAYRSDYFVPRSEVPMSKLAYIAAALMMISAPASAQIVVQDSPVAPPSQATKSAAAKSDVDKVVCRIQDTIGSRLQSHQVCMTKQQWWAYEQEAKQKVHDLQDTGFVASH
jgi:hypothetical protein